MSEEEMDLGCARPTGGLWEENPKRPGKVRKSRL